MITYIDGYYFSTPAEVLTNTVNTEGAMGKGLALYFKKLFPEMFRIYQEKCENNEIKIGSLFLFKTLNKWILNFPTKKNWRQSSKLEYIETGLKSFIERYSEWGINSIAFPALGCGNGGLNYDTEVRPLMEKLLKKIPIQIFVYPHNKNYQLPEHADIKNIKEWLRSEPRMLPFNEVWGDLKNIIKSQKFFKTFNSDNEYKVDILIENGDEMMVVILNNGKIKIPKNLMIEYWQQLRRAGFLIHKLAPSGLDRKSSYIAPIFASLNYIEKVSLSNDGINFNFGLHYTEPFVNNHLEIQTIKNYKEQLSLTF